MSRDDTIPTQLRQRREAACRLAQLPGHLSTCLAGRDPWSTCTCRRLSATEIRTEQHLQTLRDAWRELEYDGLLSHEVAGTLVRLAGNSDWWWSS